MCLSEREEKREKVKLRKVASGRTKAYEKNIEKERMKKEKKFHLSNNSNHLLPCKVVGKKLEKILV